MHWNVPYITKKKMYVLAAILVTVGLVYTLLVAAPFSFPDRAEITIESGQTLSSVSKQLVDARVIRSRALFEFFVIASGREHAVVAGPYLFEKPIPVFSVAQRIVRGRYGVAPIRITIPEGFTNKQIATLVAGALPNVSADAFLELSESQEGYLFPDTYFFFPSTTTTDVYQKLTITFEKKMQPYQDAVTDSGRSLEEIVTMASIVEREARGREDAATIAGVLWKRLDRGIALQVDAPFFYLLGKESRELTQADLALDSPYNTYRYRGLPPAPIGNPGIVSLEAALYPEPSPYLYYLHDQDGNVYYGRTFDEHRENKRLYLP